MKEKREYFQQLFDNEFFTIIRNIVIFGNTVFVSGVVLVINGDEVVRIIIEFLANGKVRRNEEGTRQILTKYE